MAGVFDVWQPKQVRYYCNFALSDCQNINTNTQDRLIIIMLYVDIYYAFVSSECSFLWPLYCLTLLIDKAPKSHGHRTQLGAVARSVACLLPKQRSNDGSSHLAHSFVEK